MGRLWCQNASVPCVCVYIPNCLILLPWYYSPFQALTAISSSSILRQALHLVSLTFIFFSGVGFLSPRPTPKMWDQASVFIAPGDRVAQLCPWTLGSAGTSGSPFPVPTYVGYWGAIVQKFRNQSMNCNETCCYCYSCLRSEIHLCTAATNGSIIHPPGDMWTCRVMAEWY
jgi:hypothetical protein